MAPPLRIRIVAAIDASVANVLNSMQTSAKRAGKKIGDDLGEGARIGAGAYRSMPAQVKAPMDQVSLSAKALQQNMGQLADGTRTKFQQLVTGLKELPPELRAVANEAQKELAKIERSRARDALGLTKQGPGFWTRERSFGRFGGVAARIGGGAVDAGLALGADLLHGMGVHTDLAGMFAESQRNETLFRNISSFGYMPGTGGPNAERVDPATLLHEAHTVGQQTGFSAGEVGEGLEKFVGLTGDLNLGRESMRDMAVLSKATGSNLMEMVEAAGAASNTLGNVPDKARVLYDVMKQVSSEGKTGAILIKDLAVQMAKIASSAQMFGGDRAHTISILGALAQEARGRGGAASASQAATSVQQFTNVFRKRQRLDTFTGFGVKVYEPGGGIRAPEDLILESFAAAMKGGHRLTPGGKHLPMPGAIGVHDKSTGWQNFETNLTALYGDVKAMRATAGFETIFKDTYAGTKGSNDQRLQAATEAVREEFNRLTIDMMDEATVQRDFQLAMQTSKSKVAVLNDQLQQTAESFMHDLLPPVLKLAPEMVLLAKGAASAVEALLGVKKPGENGMKGVWAELTGGPAPGIPAGTAESADAIARARATTEAVGAAMDLANRRQQAGALVPTGAASGLPAYALFGAPGAVGIAGGASEIVDEHARALAGAVALARGRVADVKGRESEAARTLATYTAGGLVTGGIAGALAGAAQGINVAHSDIGAEELAASKELMNAEQAQSLARTIADAVKEGLATGKFEVTVVEDKTKKPGAAGADQATAGAESQL